MNESERTELNEGEERDWTTEPEEENERTGREAPDPEEEEWERERERDPLLSLNKWMS